MAERLGLPPSSVRLGPNIVENPSFEQRQFGRFSGWQASYTIGNPNFNPAAFTVTADPVFSYDGTTSALIVGFWHGEQDRTRTRSMNGYQLWDEQSNNHYQLKIEPGQAYLLSFAYRTEAVPETDTRVFFVPLGVDVPEIQLIATRGQWRFYATVLCNPLDSTMTVPVIIFRSSIAGRTWFDDVRLQAIAVRPPSPLNCPGSRISQSR